MRNPDNLAPSLPPVEAIKQKLTALSDRYLEVSKRRPGGQQTRALSAREIYERCAFDIREAIREADAIPYPHAVDALADMRKELVICRNDLRMARQDAAKLRQQLTHYEGCQQEQGGECDCGTLCAALLRAEHAESALKAIPSPQTWQPILHEIGIMAMTAQSDPYAAASVYRKALIDICNLALKAEQQDAV